MACHSATGVGASDAGGLVRSYVFMRDLLFIEITLGGGLSGDHP